MQPRIPTGTDYAAVKYQYCTNTCVSSLRNTIQKGLCAQDIHLLEPIHSAYDQKHMEIVQMVFFFFDGDEALFECRPFHHKYNIQWIKIYLFWFEKS